jgi:hypothetical protein
MYLYTLRLFALKASRALISPAGGTIPTRLRGGSSVVPRRGRFGSPISRRQLMV